MLRIVTRILDYLSPMRERRRRWQQFDGAVGRWLNDHDDDKPPPKYHSTEVRQRDERSN